MTAVVRDELSRCAVTRTCCRRAELTSVLRFSGVLGVVAGRVVVDVELEGALGVDRVRRAIGELYGYPTQVHQVGAGSRRTDTRYVVRVIKEGEVLVRQLGLVDGQGRVVRGLLAPVVAGGVCEAAAVWRGAFVAVGSLSDAGRSSAVELACPGVETALAMVGAARRLGVQATTKQVRGVERVTVREPEAIGVLLDRMGAPNGRLEWEQRRRLRASRVGVWSSPGFDDANTARAVHAAGIAAARVQRALDILGAEVFEQMAQVGALRVAHREASLHELGRLTDPPMTKDAVAGRIRRLLAMADRKARQSGVPDTTSAITQDMLDGPTVQV